MNNAIKTQWAVLLMGIAIAAPVMADMGKQASGFVPPPPGPYRSQIERPVLPSQQIQPAAEGSQNMPAALVGPGWAKQQNKNMQPPVPAWVLQQQRQFAPQPPVHAAWMQPQNNVQRPPAWAQPQPMPAWVVQQRADWAQQRQRAAQPPVRPAWAKPPAWIQQPQNNVQRPPAWAQPQPMPVPAWVAQQRAAWAQQRQYAAQPLGPNWARPSGRMQQPQSAAMSEQDKGAKK